MNETATSEIQPAAPPPQPEGQGPTVEFFAIGIVINLLLITAYFVWAFRQGKKRGRPRD